MPNWGKLYVQGRCKEIGVPWSEEEAVAVSEGIPVQYVRDGILSLEEYEKVKKSDDKNGTPLERQTRVELEEKAEKLKVVFTPQTPDYALARLISQAKKPKAKEEKVKTKK